MTCRHIIGGRRQLHVWSWRTTEHGTRVCHASTLRPRYDTDGLIHQLVHNISLNWWSCFCTLSRSTEWIPYFSFNKYKKSSIFGCWLLPEKFSFCPKNSGFARVLGATAPQPPWLVRLCWTRLFSALSELFVCFCMFSERRFAADQQRRKRHIVHGHGQFLDSTVKSRLHRG